MDSELKLLTHWSVERAQCSCGNFSIYKRTDNVQRRERREGLVRVFVSGPTQGVCKQASETPSALRRPSSDPQSKPMEEFAPWIGERKKAFWDRHVYVGWKEVLEM